MGLLFLTQTPSLSKKRCLRAGFLNLSLSDSFDKFLIRCKLFSNFPNLYLVGVNHPILNRHEQKHVSTHWQISPKGLSKILPS